MRSPFALAMMLLYTPAHALMITDWKNISHYPSRVIGVQWENGRLDAKHGITFGAWTIYFGTPTHYAVYVPIGEFSSISVAGDNPYLKGPIGEHVFWCWNAAVSTKLCTLSFYLAKDRCEIDVWITGKLIPRDNMSISIPCPIALDLAQ